MTREWKVETVLGRKIKKLPTRYHWRAICTFGQISRCSIRMSIQSPSRELHQIELQCALLKAHQTCLQVAAAQAHDAPLPQADSTAYDES